MTRLLLELRHDPTIDGCTCVALEVRPADYPEGLFGGANGPLGALASLLFLLAERKHPAGSDLRKLMLPVWIDGELRWVEGGRPPE